MTTIRRIGVLTGGGDCPGMNAALRALVKAATHRQGIRVIGFLDGFAGLLDDAARPLGFDDVSGILTQGGTILGASNRHDPFRVPVPGPGGATYRDRSDAVLATLARREVDAPVAIGGDGTLRIARQLGARGVPKEKAEVIAMGSRPGPAPEIDEPVDGTHEQRPADHVADGDGEQVAKDEPTPAQGVDTEPEVVARHEAGIEHGGEQAQRDEVHVRYRVLEPGGDEGADRKNDGQDSVGDRPRAVAEPHSETDEGIAEDPERHGLPEAQLEHRGFLHPGLLRLLGISAGSRASSRSVAPLPLSVIARPHFSTDLRGTSPA